MPIRQKIRDLVFSLNLTPYGLSRLIAAENGFTKTQRQRCEKHWQRILSDRGISVAALEEELQNLGYRLTLEKIPPGEGCNPAPSPDPRGKARLMKQRYERRRASYPDPDS